MNDLPRYTIQNFYFTDLLSHTVNYFAPIPIATNDMRNVANGAVITHNNENNQMNMVYNVLLINHL